MSDIGASDNSDPLDTAPAFIELVPVGEANIWIMNCSVIFGHMSTDEKVLFYATLLLLFYGSVF